MPHWGDGATLFGNWYDDIYIYKFISSDPILKERKKFISNYGYRYVLFIDFTVNKGKQGFDTIYEHIRMLLNY